MRGAGRSSHLHSHPPAVYSMRLQGKEPGALVLRQELGGLQEADLAAALPNTLCGDAPIQERKVLQAHPFGRHLVPVHSVEGGLASRFRHGHQALLAQSSLTSLAYSYRTVACRHDMQALTRARWL